MPNYFYGMLKHFQLYIRKQTYLRGLKKNTIFPAQKNRFKPAVVDE